MIQGGARPTRVLTVAMSVLAMAGGVTIFAAGPSSAVAGKADPHLTESAVTVSGTGDFSSLKVTVGQTRDLVGQVVTITWKGGAPTVPGGSLANYDYLQFMQCWGTDSADGPDRQDCSFGGSPVSDKGATYTRQLGVYAPYGLTDPKETFTDSNCPANNGSTTCLPFKTFNGQEQIAARPTDLIQEQTTNEIPYGITGPDGTGRVSFEMQSALENYSLGCGTIPSGKSKPDPCWLVIVPRGDKETDGSVPGEIAHSPGLVTSPLAASNWANRLVVKLEFQPLGAKCPIGTPETLIYGAELPAAAGISWQSALCKSGAGNFTYVTIPDDQLRSRLAATTDPKLNFLSAADAPRTAVDGAPAVYAPAAISGVAIGFLMESEAPYRAPPALKAHDGERIDSIRLNQRLVAKLLTESYSGWAGTASKVAKNAYNLTTDPEFIQLNPYFKELDYRLLVSPLLPYGSSDANALLWQWVNSDRDARDFLDGKADPWGMRINPAFKGTTFPRSDFPKPDLGCIKVPLADKPLCGLDRLPFSSTLQDGALAISRGDTLARNVWAIGQNGAPSGFGKGGRQLAGQRAVIGLVGTPAATRYSLSFASLRNGSGAYVAPTSASLLAGVQVMKPGTVPGTLTTDVTAHGSAAASKAYPLTTLTYAATVPAHLTKAEGKTYAGLITYGAGEGQHSGVAYGSLPPGYEPLPASLQKQARSVAAQITTEAGVAVTPSPTPTPSSNSTGTTTTGGGGGTPPPAPPVSSAPSSSSPASPSPTRSKPTASPSPTPTVSIDVSPVAAAVPTPADPPNANAYALGAALFLGGAALFIRAVLPWVGRRRRV